MKGLTHFTVGMMTASFFAYAVQAALIDKAWILVLGGIFGILPDTLDFKFGRYLEKFDYEIMPSDDTLNARVIAETITKAIDQAYETGRIVKVKLHTIKLGPDQWRQYSVQFFPEKKEVKAWIGPIVSTSQLPLPGTEITDPKRASYTATHNAHLEHTYEKKVSADILSGPDFAFVPIKDGVRCDFISWHRRWSHSFTLALLFSPIGYLLYGINYEGLIASLVIFSAYAAHVLVDQLGVLGSNLFFPFTKERTKGMGLFHSGNTVPNLLTNYLSIVVIIWNLNAFGLKPVFTTPWYTYFTTVLIIPSALLIAMAWWFDDKKGVKMSRETQAAEEAMAEADTEM